jgi:hypothetical protein
MNTKNKMDLISKIPNEIDWSKEIEVNINGYFNEKVDVKEEGIIFNIYPPFESKSIGVLIEWDELEELVSDFGFDEDVFKNLIEDKLNLY